MVIYSLKNSSREGYIAWLRKYSLTAVQSVGKLNAMYSVAARKEVTLQNSEDMLMTRLKVNNLDRDLMQYKNNSGFYFEKDIEDLSEIKNVCDVRCQTLTYYGVREEDFRSFMEKFRPVGIDRIVPMGKSMDFTLIWDG